LVEPILVEEAMARAVAYDPTVVERYSRRLYRRAAVLVVLATMLGAAAGIAIALKGVKLMAPATDEFDLTGITDPELLPPPRSEWRMLGVAEGIVIVAAGALAGYVLGSSRAFALRLQAQTALCQVEIERNTRREFIELGARHFGSQP
jgi:hypothetical protein